MKLLAKTYSDFLKTWNWAAPSGARLAARMKYKSTSSIRFSRRAYMPKLVPRWRRSNSKRWWKHDSAICLIAQNSLRYLIWGEWKVSSEALPQLKRLDDRTIIHFGRSKKIFMSVDGITIFNWEKRCPTPPKFTE